MAYLEIIEIRAVRSNRELLESQLQLLSKELNQHKDLQAVKVYKSVMLETDFSMHLFHNSEKADSSCSSICTQLIPSLKDFGLVNHTIWIDNSKGDN